MAVAGAGAVRSRPLRAAGRDNPDVIVIGAGMSGLYTAMLLEEQGARVLVVEGQNRIGGRVITLDDVPGKPEAGPTGFSGMYARTLDVCEQLKVPLERPVRYRDGHEAKDMIHIKGTNILHEEWEKHPLNPLPEVHKKFLPFLAMYQILLKYNFLSGLEDWIEPQFHQYDVPTFDFLRSKGISEEALNLLDIGMFTGGMRRTSLLHDMRISHWLVYGGEAVLAGAKHVVGGTQRLPEAMAGALKSEIRLGMPVVQIALGEAGAEVRCADDTIYRSKFVVSTAPFTVLRHIVIDPSPPPHQREAIDTMPYLESVKVFMVPERPYWRDDGLPPGMWTDTPIESIRAVAHGDGDTVSNIYVDISGIGARPFAFMAEKDIGAYALSWIEKLRPSAKGALKVAKIIDKGRAPFSLGDWAYWNVGQVARFGQTVRDPWGRLHFAGDGTAIMNRGVEAAMESGERAAQEIIARL
ncbi:MAG: FAD-dependent oxidoreductase [Rhodospirillaceae bacterium]|nr:FAD-dependent oxidoreductase [Rhodospirillaceae bacterium]